MLPIISSCTVQVTLLSDSSIINTIVVILYISGLECLTCISHRGEDALCDGHDGIGGLVVAADWFTTAGIVAYVLQEVTQCQADCACCSVHLPKQLSLIRGSVTCFNTQLHRALHQPACFHQLLLTHG